VGISGVPTPEKIETIDYEEPADEATGAAEKIVSAASEAADAAMTFVADTDDVQGHEEL
jgi:hypothetical protein